MLKHLPFFAALAEVEDGSAQARALKASLLTLRLLDHVALVGDSIVGPDSLSGGATRMAISEIDETDPLRPLLTGALNALCIGGARDTGPVLLRLFAVGQLFEGRQQYAMAADVFEAIIDGSIEESAADLTLDCWMRLAYCRRMLGELDGAEKACGKARAIAKHLKAAARVLHADVALANVVATRGNLPRADSILAGVIDACGKTKGATQVQASALQDRANVANWRDDYPRALEYAFGALQCSVSERQREELTSNISTYLYRMGRYEAARYPLMMLEARASSTVVLVATRVNLLAVAGRERDREAFDRYRSLLAAMDVVPDHMPNLLIETARGLATFGEKDEARQYLARAIALADQAKQNRAVFEAEELLTQLGRVETQQPSDRRPAPSRSVVRIEEQLREMALAALA